MDAIALSHSVFLSTPFGETMSLSISVVHHLTSAQIQDLEQLYKQGWWSQDRKLEDIETMLHHSDLLIGLVDTETQKLIGFTRVLTDCIYRAVIFDVLVDSSYQKQGLGQILMQEIINNPQLKSVECFILFCLPEMVSFYEKIGFQISEKMELMFYQPQHSPLINPNS